jgi:steroid delta-isomerase-like uncharacterized protein
MTKGLSEGDVNNYFEAWSAGDVDKIMAYIDEGIVYEDIPTSKLSTGQDETRSFIQKFLDDSPGLKLIPNNIMILNNKAAIEWTMSGGTGDEAWETRGATVMGHDNGKINRITDYWNE